MWILPPPPRDDRRTEQIRTGQNRIKYGLTIYVYTREEKGPMKIARTNQQPIRTGRVLGFLTCELDRLPVRVLRQKQTMQSFVVLCSSELNRKTSQTINQ